MYNFKFETIHSTKKCLTLYEENFLEILNVHILMILTNNKIEVHISFYIFSFCLFAQIHVWKQTFYKRSMILRNYWTLATRNVCSLKVRMDWKIFPTSISILLQGRKNIKVPSIEYGCSIFSFTIIKSSLSLRFIVTQFGGQFYMWPWYLKRYKLDVVNCKFMKDFKIFSVTQTPSIWF